MPKPQRPPTGTDTPVVKPGNRKRKTPADHSGGTAGTLKKTAGPGLKAIEPKGCGALPYFTFGQERDRRLHQPSPQNRPGRPKTGIRPRGGGHDLQLFRRHAAADQYPLRPRPFGGICQQHLHHHHRRHPQQRQGSPSDLISIIHEALKKVQNSLQDKISSPPRVGGAEPLTVAPAEGGTKKGPKSGWKVIVLFLSVVA